MTKPNAPSLLGGVVPATLSARQSGVAPFGVDMNTAILRSLANGGTSCSWRIRRPRSHIVRHSTSILNGLFHAYQANGQPVPVCFRRLVGPIPAHDLTHSIYPYPARLLRHIPRFFLRCDQLVDASTIVLDPFCGSGTVLVEAHAAGVSSCGIDSNPFARLLSRVKTTALDHDATLAAATRILHRAKRIRSGDIPDVVNVDLWYAPPVKRALGRLRRAVLEAQLPTPLHRFMLVCLACVADQSSLRDPRIPVPVRHPAWKQIRSGQKPDVVWRCFQTVTRRAAKQVALLQGLDPTPALVAGTSACEATSAYRKLPDRWKPPGLILTSPPYGAAQKYIRSTSLALGWTGLATTADLRRLDAVSIGREHLRKHELTDLDIDDCETREAIHSIAARDPLRASIYAHYFRAMDTALADISALLAPGGNLVLVAGSNIVAGKPLPTHRLLRSLGLRHGLQPTLALRDTIRGRFLLTKRASGAPPLRAETIYILSKSDR